MLQDKIRRRENGIVLYGMVPPKVGTPASKVAAIAQRQRERLTALPIDGLVLYDLQDEAARQAGERPFPFIETLDPCRYAADHLAELDVCKIVYRAVGKYDGPELDAFLADMTRRDWATVFVGAASRDQNVRTTIQQAYQAHARTQQRSQTTQAPLLGGVAIPERHQQKRNEHLRVLAKIAQGCSFFVSQGVYDVHASKNFLSDYYYTAQERGVDMVPIIFTFTPCGSVKTLEFMKWLGIHFPRWLENELLHSRDILEQSLKLSERNWQELRAFAAEKGIPVGCNVESVAVRKVEVEASVELLQRLVR